MHDIQWQDILSRTVNDVLLHKLLGDIVFVVDEEGVKLVGHGFRLLVQGHRLGDILGGKDKGLAHRHSADHHLIIILILLRQFLQLQVTVIEVHDILEALLADGGEILWRFELRLCDYEVQHHFIFVLAGEFALIDGVDCVRVGVPME